MPQSKKGSSNLGQTLIRDRFAYKGRPRDHWVAPADAAERALHKEALLKSSTAPSDLDEFLATATLAGTEFEAERYNVKLVVPNPRAGVLSAAEEKAARKLHEDHKELLSVPRRPSWDASTTAQDLDEKERKAFLEWRAQLSDAAEIETLVVTPYEKNLEVWRQLWRVLERSDVVVQIVDARNPLLYYCEDLARYANEISSDKDNLILVNKADLLSEKQREQWARHFEQAGLRAVFFSAKLASEELESQDDRVTAREHEETEALSESESGADESGDDAEDELMEATPGEEKAESAGMDSSCSVPEGTTDSSASGVHLNLHTVHSSEHPQLDLHCSCKMFDRDGLIAFLKSLHGNKPTVLEKATTIGFVGYPNVGKSSTLNALMQHKRVSVSATPGKTKHFQTMHVDKDLMLCDCPGLVMPSFAMSSAEMTVSGILPVDQMRDYIPPINLICSRIPRGALEGLYGISLPFRKEYGVDYEIIPPPTAEEFLNAYGTQRGYVTARGLPDIALSARHVLKDHVNGKLLFCHAPPNAQQTEYFSFVDTQISDADPVNANEDNHPQAFKGTKTGKIDADFFASIRPVAYEKRGGLAGVRGVLPGNPDNSSSKRHFKKNKKEKLRRTFRDLDVH